MVPELSNQALLVLKCLDFQTECILRHLTWSDAAAYCNWLSEKESLVPAYENIDGQYKLKQPITNGYRLPTEAEWEWVSRYNGGAGEQRYHGRQHASYRRKWKLCR